jgi:hypothetical protein
LARRARKAPIRIVRSGSAVAEAGKFGMIVAQANIKLQN